MIEKIIEYSAKNRFFVILITSLLTLWGVWSMLTTPLDAIPDLSDVQVIVLSEWPGRSPDLVEDQITYPIVSTLLAAPRVKTVRGFSYFGLSFVYVIFDDGTDIYWARSRVLEYLSKLRNNIPQDVSPVIGPDATGVGWVYQYALVDRSGNRDLAELRSLQDWYLKYSLESLKGVAEVASIGGYVKEYQVRVAPDKLQGYNIPVTRLINAIRESNRDVGGRVIDFNGREFMVKGKGYARSVDDLSNIVIDTDTRGTPLRIRDVATVTVGPSIRRGVGEFNGEGETVGGIVVMRFGENALEVIKRVKERLEELKKSLPTGVEVVPVYDRSDLIYRAIDTLRDKLIEESIIVSIVCIVFLFHFRSSFVAIITLPIAIVLSFITFKHLYLTSNIMSLGGIAIAIGAMVDAAIVMIENAHKQLEHNPDAPRFGVILTAAKQVGKPLFFSLLIITISFIPVFTLEAQEGRLFKPLSFTKTFSMFFASLLSITLVPVLMVSFIKGKITPEAKNPVSRILIFLYRPFVRLALRFKYPVILVSIVSVLATIPVFGKLGSEFMPVLNEGTIFYMPTTLPGISVQEAAKSLQVQDAILKTVPEVETVYGKVGRAETATDPAPLGMAETVVMLKPENQWRTGLTWQKLIDELDSKMKVPGWVNSWTMPIKARIDMLSTGIKTPVGIKIFGPQPEVLQKIGGDIEKALAGLEGTRSIYAERSDGGYYFDIVPDKAKLSRYGLRIEDVNRVIESAIGGMSITRTVEGRERYPVTVRYKRGLRKDVESVKRVLVPAPMSAMGASQIPLGEVAEVKLRQGPGMLKEEDGLLVSYVFIDISADQDVGSYVHKAQKIVSEKVTVPPGYLVKWSGQYEYMERAKERLLLVIPITLVLIFVLLYANFRSVTESFIVMLSVPFALVGGLWYIYLLGYNLSVAVWVGIIALAGVAAETGVVMIVYLDEAYEKHLREGRLHSIADLHEAVVEGAVQRVRPKIMTVTAIIAGLVPIMWSHGTGADVMKRIAAPMIGGMVTSTILTLVIIPAVYVIWKNGELKRREKKHELPH